MPLEVSVVPSGFGAGFRLKPSIPYTPFAFCGRGPEEFTGVGKGFRVTFTPRSGLRAGIGAVDEGSFVDGKWAPGRRLNGDENDQGKAWRFDSGKIRTEKVSLYRFE